MQRFARAACVLLLVCATPAYADLAKVTDAEFDAQFRCPESVANPEVRSNLVTGFVRWAKARHPDWSISDMVKARIALLMKHQCSETLKQLEQPASGSAVTKPQ